MNSHDIRPLGQILQRTFLVYERELAPEMIVVWFDALAEYTLEDVATALSRHLRDPDNGRFAPKPSDVSAHLAGGTGVQALRAWSTVERAVRSVGHYQSVCFDDAIIHKVIEEMGGWQKLALTPTVEQMRFSGLEFQRRYQGAVLTGGVGTDYPAYLVGAAEAHNATEGQRTQAPVLIGNPAKCQEVMARAGGDGPFRISQTPPMLPKR